MNISATIILALAIPAVLVGCLLPPALLHNRLQTVSGELPEGLRKAIGLGREHKFSAWNYAILLVLLFSNLAPESLQAGIGAASGLVVALYAGSRSKAYFVATNEYGDLLSSKDRQLLYTFGYGAALFCLLFLFLAFWLAIQ